MGGWLREMSGPLSPGEGPRACRRPGILPSTPADGHGSDMTPIAMGPMGQPIVSTDVAVGQEGAARASHTGGGLLLSPSVRAPWPVGAWGP